ncbi:hypothetical protein [Gordonia alkanivorans]|uniref:hypothetical protein n=1 Tax=Gordonia alkanivorans TaxID=84096 RepID=UPI0024B74EBF|nr:hypothetical protein [Gordonia alkanivorans]MDJ0010119.1 hypothetical protein [Gordonia alkanivorans]MDJ0495691.1 hypothetical protein [Gordonia alkanivorans]
MPRIRAIKPEFWSSPSHPIDPWARLLYVAMWNWADDAGVGTANLKELAGFAFPNDDHIDVGAMRRMCADIAAHYGAQFYTVAGRPYFSIPSWREHQKFDKRRDGRHPGPECAEEWLYQQERSNAAHCADTAPTLRPQVGALPAPEQGNRGTGELSSSDQPEPERIDVKRVVSVLVDALRARGVKTPKSTTTWEKSARLLLDVDDRPLDEVIAVLEWSQRDEFWSKNILSMPKFREKYDQLRLKADVRTSSTQSPEEFLNDCWDKATIAPITELTGRRPDCIRWPDPIPADFDQPAYVRDFHRRWIKENRDELVQALKGRL